MKDKKLKKEYLVYQHINKINGMKYTGHTCQTLEHRAMGRYKKTKYFSSVIEEYGWDNFEHVVRKTVYTKEDALYWEEYYTKEDNTIWPNGYNERAAQKHSEESLRKMKESLKGREAWNKGKHWSEDVKQKLSKAKKDLYEKGYINPRKGTPCSEEQKQLFKERMKEYCKEHGGPMTGKHHSEETKKKISNSRKGSPSTTKGKHRYTNGKIRIYRFECPEGFWQDKTNCK